MSLVVWLPLNGDLKNNGASNVTVTNNGATVLSDGKIGQCYNFGNGSASDKGISINNNFTSIGSYRSICAWVRPKGNHYHYAGAIVSSGNWNASRWSFGVEQSNSGFTGFDSGYTNYYSTSIPVNTWTHLCVTVNNGITKFYKNGQYLGQQSRGSGTVDSDASNTMIGRETYAGGYFTFNGDICDVRIYDHTLSDAEVHEIAKGLVVHYKFDTESLKGSGNLVTGLSGGGQCSISGSTVSVTGNNSDTYFYVKTSAALTSGRTYRISCTGNFADGKYYYFPIGSQSNTSPGQLIVKNGYCSLVFTANDTIANAGTNIILDDTSRNPGAGTITNIVLEEISGIYDCSGYQYNGTTPSGISPIIINDSPRYESNANFDTTSKKINTSFTCSGFANSYSISWWGKASSYSGIMFWGFSNMLNYYDGLYWNTGDGGDNPFYTPNTTTTINRPSVNVWHHFVITGDGTTTKLYMDGSHYGTAKTYKSLSSVNAFRINGWLYDESYRVAGMEMSDFRIYSTVLSADDVKQLYNVGASVDKSQNISNFEEVEAITNIISNEDYGIKSKQWLGGLSSYTQNNCSCTLTDDGYRIYRTPDLVYSSAGTVMWGGFVLRNFDNRYNFQIGHTYLLQFEVKGQTSNPVHDIYWTNQIGWGGGGLEPSPSNVIVDNPVTSNYNSSEWKTFSYKWTINDSIYKTCTYSYSGFSEGNTYLSYRDFKYGFGYTDTGSLGTDLYIRNIRMFDITSNQNTQIFKTGVIKAISFVEEDVNTKVTLGGLTTNQLIEK